MFKRKAVLLLISLVLVASMLAACAPQGQDTSKGQETSQPAPQPAEQTADVVVVGGGGAGLSAAIEAAGAGASVILLEKMQAVGGSTANAGGIIYGAETPDQKRAGINDTWQALVDYWVQRADGDVDKDLLTVVAQKSGETIGWIESLGVTFRDPMPAGTSPVPRGHLVKEGAGTAIIKALEKQAKAKGVKILTSTKATKLLVESGKITGVTAQTSDGKEASFKAKAVILATGGFDRNPELMAQYVPTAKDVLTWVGEGNTGDGLIMARDVGAEIVAKGGVIGFRGVAPELPFMTPLGGTAFNPTLWINEKGKRFINEATDYPLFYNEMVKTGGSKFFAVFDSTAPQNIKDALESGIEKGYVFKASTVEDLAGKIGVDKATFAATLKRYNELAKKGNDEDFKKPKASMTPIEKADFYAVKMSKGTIGTMGGPKINTKTEVLDTKGNVIPGLYAAGEVANGQFFKDTYPASGTSIQMCLTLGRIAGKEAANYGK
ncbi:MAG: flavocytochrome c [Clostridiales bacterium]|jgi:fumarate reductase flavoprotein subunit|nr:flavocytochrome c [Eubacteriales bacterium]MDH7565632.1 flavocytochrome c [Clostridiales bacterium]